MKGWSAFPLSSLSAHRRSGKLTYLRTLLVRIYQQWVVFTHNFTKDLPKSRLVFSRAFASVWPPPASPLLPLPAFCCTFALPSLPFRFCLSLLPFPSAFFCSTFALPMVFSVPCIIVMHAYLLRPQGLKPLLSSILLLQKCLLVRDPYWLACLHCLQYYFVIQHWGNWRNQSKHFFLPFISPFLFPFCFLISFLPSLPSAFLSPPRSVSLMDCVEMVGVCPNIIGVLKIRLIYTKLLEYSKICQKECKYFRMFD